jgi:hypothetical protein
VAVPTIPTCEPAGAGGIADARFAESVIIEVADARFAESVIIEVADALFAEGVIIESDCLTGRLPAGQAPRDRIATHPAASEGSATLFGFTKR